ncbi:MAG TPA: ABC transporter ATP-binding protein [Pseudonocardiaceae bacterium]|jgi:peptide/nickel transport system ATP-binding protein|nr:ABC transporter ATP-binding protein [Pseudonocardiaceae bacterium]
MSELRFEDVTVRYGTRRRGLTAVDGVSLAVPAGEIVGLVGESGSGKSTLARAAVGIAPLTAGRVLLDGRPVPMHGRRRPVQLVFQDPYSSLDPRMTIGASIGETVPRRDSATGSALDRRAEIIRLLEFVELDPALAGSFPGQLSGGQRQRVALARALAARPEVVIADEITSALDVSIQGTVLNLLRDLLGELGTSMLFISHNLAVVRYVASSIAVMYLGRIVEYGPAAQVLGDPQHPYTRDLLAAVPESGHPAGRIADPTPQAVADAEPADPHHPPSGCHYHPRCPIGPLVRPERDICRTTAPGPDHRQHAACHFAGSPTTSQATNTPTPTARPVPVPGDPTI